MPHLLVAGKLHPAGVKRLEDLRTSGVTIDYVEEVSEASYAGLIHRADAMVIRTQPMTSATIELADRLKVVSRHGVGYDSVDVEALNRRGIALTIVGDVNSVSVAEHAMMQLLAGAKQAMRADRAVRDPAHWNWRNRLEQREISSKNLLIIGFGRAGRHLARMASGFDMTVRAHDPFLDRQGWPAGPVASAPDLSEALAWADCISVHVPKGDRPLLGHAELRQVKPGVIIANTARGGVIDEAALSEALADGRVSAAGIDVFDDEPPTGNSPLARYDNALLSPHIAGLTEEAAMRMALASIDNAMGFLDGTIDHTLIVNRQVTHA
jgi:D-3-phosphoglycerate dehydrogenase / 2-oxoglutarate reductase